MDELKKKLKNCPALPLDSIETLKISCETLSKTMKGYLGEKKREINDELEKKKKKKQKMKKKGKPDGKEKDEDEDKKSKKYHGFGVGQIKMPSTSFLKVVKALESSEIQCAKRQYTNYYWLKKKNKVDCDKQIEKSPPAETIFP